MNVINADFTPVDQFTENDKWHELRKTGLGGSDAGAIMGLNKYSSPLNVYFQKKGVKGFEGNAATEWGHILEDPIREKTRKELNVNIQTIAGMYTSKEYPFMNANVDGFIVVPDGDSFVMNGENLTGIGIHEIKTSANGDGFKEDEIPDSYYCQVQHYMAVTQLDWAVLTVFILSKKQGKHYLIKRNDNFILDLIKAEKDFWENYVEKEIIPEPMGVDSEIDFIEKLPMVEEIILSTDLLPLIEEKERLSQQEKEIKQEIEKIKNKLLLSFYDENSNGSKNTVATVGEYKLSYSTSIRKSVDTDLLKKDGLYENYLKTTETKTFRISKKKGGK
jgi:putative phage-type endonuclease